MHYSWKGYTNCVDVDFFNEQVESKYGIDLPEPVFERIDHCQFVDFSHIVSPIFDATISPTLAKQYMVTHNPLNSYENGVGINVVPLKLPGDVFQPTPAMLPWDKSRRSDSRSEQIRIEIGAKSLLKMNELELGTPQRSDNFMEQLMVQRTEKTACSRIVYMGQHLAKEGVQCSETTKACTRDDYRRIIQIYSNIYAQEDTGQSPRFRLRGRTNNDDAPMISVTKRSNDQVNLISYCTTAETKVDGTSFILQWDWATRTDTGRFNSPAVDEPEIKISFQYSYISLPDGWYGDFGHTFSQKNSYKWSLAAVQEEYCQQSIPLEECQLLGESKTFANVLNGSLLGENLGFGENNTSSSASRFRPTGCYQTSSGNYYAEGEYYSPIFRSTVNIFTSARACHDECKAVDVCAHWTWYSEHFNNICKLSAAGAILKPYRGYTSNKGIFSGSKHTSTDTPSVYYNKNINNNKCSPEYPCLCKAMDGQYYQPVQTYKGIVDTTIGMNVNKDCWRFCGKQNGDCVSYCGTGGKCCKQGLAIASCSGSEGPTASVHGCVAGPSAKESPGLSYGWNCDVSADLVPIKDGKRHVHASLRNQDFTGVRVEDACTTPKTSSFGGQLTSDNDGVHFYKTWELELPGGNGEYEIEIRSEHTRMSGCVLENYALMDLGFKLPNQVVRRFVRDGRLTLTGHSNFCKGIVWIKIHKVSAINRTLAPSIFPSSSNIVWEQEILESNTSIGDGK